MALRRFGGNSGYIGYSMSKRAANARMDGKYPKTDFKREYGLSETIFNVLKSIKIIGCYEWHHTGKYGRRTDFYEWVDNEYHQIYEARKNEIKALIRKIPKAPKLDDYPITHEGMEDYNQAKEVYLNNREAILLQIRNIFWE